MGRAGRSPALGWAIAFVNEHNNALLVDLVRLLHRCPPNTLSPLPQQLLDAAAAGQRRYALSSAVLVHTVF